MTSDQTTRVGDRERELVSAELRAHFTSGRLGMDDFSSRLDQAWSATTLADLQQAVRDLPPAPGNPRPWDRPGAVPGQSWPTLAGPGPRQIPQSTVLQRSVPQRSCAERMARPHVRGFVNVAIILMLIWALTGFGYFWPIWPLACWGFFVVRHAMWARRRERDRAAAYYM